VIVVAFAAPAFAQISAKDPTAEDVPAYNDFVARSFLIEVEPLVEKYTGWDCEWPVPFHLVTRAECADAMAKELRPRLLADFPSDPRTEAMLKSMFRAHSVGLLGYYSSQSKSLFFLPGNLKPVLRSLGVDERLSHNLIELILAHELTHSVQDAVCHITERAMKLQGEDESAAWTMIVEGHASWVADRVAEELHTSEAAQRLAEGFAKSNVSPTWRNSKAHEAANVRGYTAGKKFVAEVYARGGIKAVQALFEKPPKSASLIENPELFFANENTGR
jgi:hypothetical protein